MDISFAFKWYGGIRPGIAVCPSDNGSSGNDREWCRPESNQCGDCRRWHDRLGIPRIGQRTGFCFSFDEGRKPPGAAGQGDRA